MFRREKEIVKGRFALFAWWYRHGAAEVLQQQSKRLMIVHSRDLCYSEGVIRTHTVWVGSGKTKEVKAKFVSDCMKAVTARDRIMEDSCPHSESATTAIS